MAQPTVDMAGLAERVQALPPELYNLVLDYTLTTPNAPLTIKKSYKPPSQLQINRALRDEFAKAYYGSTIFEAASCRDLRVLRKFVFSLTSKHTEYFKTVRMVCRHPGVHDYISWIDNCIHLAPQTGLQGVKAAGRRDATAVAHRASRELHPVFSLRQLFVNVFDDSERERFVSLDELNRAA